MIKEEKFKINWVIYEETVFAVIKPYFCSKIVFSDGGVWESNGYLVHSGKDYLVKDKEVKRV